MADQRAYDVVLLGGTGFTGGLTAEYLARNMPEGFRWALAGRNPAKLEALRQRLAAIDPACADLPLLHADSGEPASLEALARDARVVISTVGPYLLHGEPLVAACAAHGADYVDLTGEPEFVDLMYVRHHARAAETGARLVHCCGFDSVPHDLGAYLAVKQLPEGVPLVLRGLVRAGARFSGGTFHSAIGIVSRPRETRAVAKQRRALEPRPHGRRVRGVRKPPHREPELGSWALPAPTIDPQIVLRSAAALDRYGPDFSYGHYLALPLPAAAGLALGAGAFAAAVQVPPVRRWISGRMASGEGPDERRRERSWFNVRFVGEGGGARTVVEVSGGDPGYGETSKMLAESALCLAFDELPDTAGQVTTAVAMGDALTERLERAGIGFRVLEPGA